MLSNLKQPITAWQAEQLDALRMVRSHLAGLDSHARKAFRIRIADYLDFRRELDAFLDEHFHHICTRNCYTSNKSACCGKDSIIVFFAEVVINALVATEDELDRLVDTLARPNPGSKCAYLGPDGCLWRLRPVVCALFLCDPSETEVFRSNARLRSRWMAFKKREKDFKWPDKAVLFDDLEKLFIAAGYRSPLMYCHTSPGLLRVKRLAGLAPEGKGRAGKTLR